MEGITVLYTRRRTTMRSHEPSYQIHIYDGRPQLRTRNETAKIPLSRPPRSYSSKPAQNLEMASPTSPAASPNSCTHHAQRKHEAFVKSQSLPRHVMKDQSKRAECFMYRTVTALLVSHLWLPPLAPPSLEARCSGNLIYASEPRTQKRKRWFLFLPM